MTPSVRRRRDCPPTPELQRVLDDAAAPGYDAELAGLHAAVLAFATTSHAPARAVSWSLARLVATPIAALVAATSLGGGVALAAATGNLPDAVQSIAAKLGAPAPDGAGDGADVVPPRPDADATATRPGGGRCTAVTVGGKDANGKALQSTALATAVAEGCPGGVVPGSRRSETGKDKVADKAVSPGAPRKPVKAVTPTPAAKPRPVRTEDRPAPADKRRTTVTTDPATAVERTAPVDPETSAPADVPAAAPATGLPVAGSPAPARQAAEAPVQQSRASKPPRG